MIKSHRGQLWICRRAGTILQALIGHADVGTHGLYGSRLAIKLLDSAMRKISYPLDLFHLLIEETVRVHAGDVRPQGGVPSPEQIAEKQDQSLREVRERRRQELLDGGSAQNKTSTTDRVRRQLLRLRKTWLACQRNRDRDAIYEYLGAVYELVERWQRQGQVESRARRVRMLLQKTTTLELDPFALVIWP